MKSWARRFFYADSGGWGWLRVGPVLFAWQPVHARAYFSERMGFERWYGVGPWRVRLSLRRSAVAKEGTDR